MYPTWYMYDDPTWTTLTSSPGMTTVLTTCIVPLLPINGLSMSDDVGVTASTSVVTGSVPSRLSRLMLDVATVVSTTGVSLALVTSVPSAPGLTSDSKNMSTSVMERWLWPTTWPTVIAVVVRPSVVTVVYSATGVQLRNVKLYLLIVRRCRALWCRVWLLFT